MGAEASAEAEAAVQRRRIQRRERVPRVELGLLGGRGAGFVFLLIAVVVVLAVVRAQRRLSSFQGEGAGFMASTSAVAPAPLTALQARDPALTEESIASHVRQMADILRQAWCAGDMRPARAFVSDGVFSRFQVQLALMRQENRRNVMSDASVISTSLEAVESAEPLDVVHVRVTAQARDTEVPVAATDEQIHKALAHAPIEPYTEIWSLVRRTGAQTKPADFPVGRACPSCGAPLDGGETIKCRHCGTLACSGEHDWVLAEITQLVEWRPARRGGGARGARGARGEARAEALDTAAAIAELRRRDPGVALEVLEDRGSYVFWIWVQAGRAGEVSPLRKCASPALLANGGPSSAHLEATRGATDVAVGGADVVRCDLNGADGFDRVHVEVLWSARFRQGAPPTPSKVVMRLARRTWRRPYRGSR